MTKGTRSPARAEYDPADLKRLRISPEVGWYLASRGIPLPKHPPAVKTPEPGELLKSARFDAARVDKVIDAFSRLRHTQGKWAGQPLRPDPWQVAYVIAPVFGWVRRNRAGRWVRVIRSLYVDVPRKNGKSTLCGGIAIYLTCADGESGAQVLAGATTKDQAGFVFAPVKLLAQKSPALRPHVRAMQNKIVHPASGSYFQVISNVADAQHGANIHGAVVDELHVHKTADLVEAIDTGTGSRDQPLIAYITTADSGKQGTIYARKRERIEKLARRVFRHPATYGVVFAADKADDPFSPETWAKANPGLGVSPTIEFLESQAAEARQSPVQLAAFQRLHLGIRTKQETKFLQLSEWDRNASTVDEQLLRGRMCAGGLDLASTTDLCALAWDFPDGVGGHDVVWRHWLPEGAFDDLVDRTAGQARVWRSEGWLTVTSGDVVDYDFIREQVNRDRERFAVAEVAYDPWNATQVVTDLTNDGVTMTPLRQGFASLSGPTKELQRLLKEGTARRPRYRHGGNPLVRWQVDNLAVAMDAAGNVKPDKAVAADKIDGLAAGVNALWAAVKVKPPKRSAYEDRGLEVV